MIIALIGVTGVGKTYYKNIVSNKLNFEAIKTIRSRKRRKNENDASGYFYDIDKIRELEKTGEIIYSFEVFNNVYAYLKEDIITNKNKIFEMHYETIDDWKKINPDIVSIYIVPNDINQAIAELKKRGLTEAEEKIRYDELMEHYNKYLNDKDFIKKFDHVFINNYDQQSEKDFVELVKNLSEGV